MERWKRSKNEKEINIDQIYNGEQSILKRRNKVKEKFQMVDIDEEKEKFNEKN